jgi:Ca2+-binding RTX toxin-like protein
MAKTINLTDKNDTRNGGSADEIINAKGGNDTVTGGGGNDKLDGGSGNDKLTGGTGNDTIIGGDGNDTATYAGALEDDNGNRLYTFELNDNGQLLVTDLSGKDGMDTVASVEFLKFADQTVAVADIVNELTAITPMLSMDPTQQSVNEGTGAEPTEVTINLSLSSASDQPVSVHVSTAEGTAKPQSDYIPLDQTITFEPGETDQLITVSIAADSVKEGSEQFTVKLDKPQGLEIEGNGVATIGIIDDDSSTSSQVGIQTSNVKITEGNAGSKTATVTVTLTGSSPNKVTVDYATLDGSATAGSDYVKKSGTLTFNPGETKKTVNITINGDTQSEGDETFSLNLSNPQGAKLNTSKATVTIQDDDGGIQPSENHAPLPKDDSFINLPAGQQVIKTGADLVKNDQDPDGDALTVTKVADATGGVVSLNSAGQIIFTPSGEDVESGSYSYTVSDGKGGTASANVLLQFTAPENHAPQAKDDSFTGLPANAAATQTTASLLKNDSDPDGDTLTVSAVSNAVNGTISLSGNVVTFTPQTGASNGSYQYSINDGHGGTASATVKLGFVLPNQAPDAVDDSFTDKPANQALTIATADLLKNDSDPDKNPLKVTAVSDAQNGTVELISGNVVFTPTQDASSASFQYTIEDGKGGSDTAKVSLGFVAGSTPPVGKGFVSNGGLEFDLNDDANNFVGTELNDKLGGLGGADTLNGGDGNDSLTGGMGNDSLDGGNGDDTVDGGEGDDSIFNYAGEDILLGGDGNDYIEGNHYSHETVYGGGGDDSIYHNNGGDSLIDGGDGNDVIHGYGDGNDTLLGGNGDDNIGVIGTWTSPSWQTEAGNDSIDGGAGNDFLHGGSNNDTILGGAGNDSIAGGYDNDLVDGGEGDDLISDYYGNDTLKGGDGSDQLHGSYDNDVLDGGAGVDALYGEDGNDVFVFNPGDSGVGVGNRDIIKDFSATSTSELIDLHNLSSNALTFKGSAAFTGADQVRYTLDFTANSTLVQVNLDADTSKPELEIELVGTMGLTASDFVLATPPAV